MTAAADAETFAWAVDDQPPHALRQLLEGILASSEQGGFALSPSDRGFIEIYISRVERWGFTHFAIRREIERIIREYQAHLISRARR